METPFVVPVTGLLINDFIDPWTKAFTINSVGILVAPPESRLFQRRVSGSEQETIATAERIPINLTNIPQCPKGNRENQKMKMNLLETRDSELSSLPDHENPESYLKTSCTI